MADTILMIAVTSIKSRIEDKADLPLDDLLTAAFTTAIKNNDDHFFMGGFDDDNESFRAAIAAVMSLVDEDKQALIRDALKPLQMLNAATQDVPVDWNDFRVNEDAPKLMALFNAAKAA